MIYGSLESQKWHRDKRGQETMNEADHFYGHLIYFNSDDKRIFVPKKTGGGFTINFANPISVMVGAFLIGEIVALIVIREM